MKKSKTKTDGRSKKRPTKKTDANRMLTTHDLHRKWNVSTKKIRRCLRSMEKFDDGKYTNYRFNGWNDKTVIELKKRLNK